MAVQADPEDDSWADPLSRKERRTVADLLARACREFWEAAAPRPLRARMRDLDECEGLRWALIQASKEMSDLHLDVTERAKAVRP